MLVFHPAIFADYKPPCRQTVGHTVVRYLGLYGWICHPHNRANISLPCASTLCQASLALSTPPHLLTLTIFKKRSKEVAGTDLRHTNAVGHLTFVCGACTRRASACAFTFLHRSCPEIKLGEVAGLRSQTTWCFWSELHKLRGCCHTQIPPCSHFIQLISHRLKLHQHNVPEPPRRVFWGLLALVSALPGRFAVLLRWVNSNLS